MITGILGLDRISKAINTFAFCHCGKILQKVNLKQKDLFQFMYSEVSVHDHLTHYFWAQVKEYGGEVHNMKQNCPRSKD